MSDIALKKELNEKKTTKEGGIKFLFSMIVTLHFTNAEGNVTHDAFPVWFGMTRELFGMKYIPNFIHNLGKQYLLLTQEAKYSYRKNLYFGNEVRVLMWISSINSASFVLEAEFRNENNDLCAMGTQTIVFADANGKPQRLPKQMKSLLEGVMI